MGKRAALSVTRRSPSPLHAKDEASLKEMTQRAKACFDPLAFRQREGFAAPGPQRRGGVEDAGHVIAGAALPLLAAGRLWIGSRARPLCHGSCRSVLS